AEERYLVELLERRPHERATCAGESCFCRQHDRLFDETAAHVFDDRGSKGGDRGREGGSVEEQPPRKRARRNKTFWEGHQQCSHTVAPQGWTARPPTEARGKEAIRGWVDACTSCSMASLAAVGGRCEHGEALRVRTPVMLLTTEAVQVTKPKLARLSDAHAVHDPLVTSLDRPVPVSKLRDCHFAELSEKGLLSAPCPLGPPACGGSWVEQWGEAEVTAAQWSQRVRLRVYHCQCLNEAHAIHFDGEHLGLFTWNRRTIFVQESLQLLLRGMQHGHSFKAELATHQAAFQRSPDAAVLSEETWRRASLDFFKLVGLGLRECCSLCGHHPKVLLCDGIVGLASTDGSQKPGGLGSSSLDARRTFCHPSRELSGALLEKRSISGRDYCAAGLHGGGIKRKLLLQPELREALARLSQHRPKDEKLGKRLSRVDFEVLIAGLAHGDTTIVKRFGAEEAEGPLSEDGKRRMLAEQQTMVRDRNLAVFELLTGIQADFKRRGLSSDLWEHWVGEWVELLYSLGAHDSDEDLIGVGALHVVRKLLLGSEASLEDRRELGRDAPILRRLLDSYGGLTFPAFFMRTLHHLYLLALLARGATGFEAEGRLGWVHEAIDPFERAVSLLAEARRRPLSIEERQRLDETRGLANELLPGVERFHFAKAGSEVHKCGPSNCPESYCGLHWVNTSAVESVNSFLKGFRSLGWYSGLDNLMVILPLLLGGYNSSLRRVDDAKISIAIGSAVWVAGIRRRLLLG
ncbi:hypothetical protein KFL_002360010, partial [Klebsormidium nitens]